MSVLEFKPRKAVAVAKDVPWQWECGKCQSDAFKHWNDGIVTCHNCDTWITNLSHPGVKP